MNDYLIAIIITAGLGSLMIVAMLQSKFGFFAQLPLNSVYMMVLVSIDIFALFFLKYGLVPSHGLVVLQIPFALLGVMLGFVVYWCDSHITKTLALPNPDLTTAISAKTHGLPINHAITVEPYFPESEKVDDSVHSARSRSAQKKESSKLALINLVLIAGGEELLYRGILLNLCVAKNHMLNWWGVIAIVLFFSLSHIAFGLTQVIAKLPLSILTTAATVLSGSLLCAINIHVVFNMLYWNQQRVHGGVQH